MTEKTAAQAEIDHAMSTLTPEERAAMADDDGDEANLDALKAIAAAADDDDDDGDGEETAAAPEDGAAAATAADPTDKDAPDAKAGTPPPAAPPPTAAAEVDEDDAPMPPAFQFNLPDDFEQRVADVKASKAAVYQRLRDGEIDVADLPAELEALNDQQRKLDSMQTQADVAARSSEATAQAYQRREIAKVFNAARANGIDYSDADKDKVGDLDLFMKALAAKDENADKPYRWFLEEAHKRVMAMHGKAAQPPEPGAKKEKPTRKPPLDAVPPSLANIPGGDGPGDVGGEFDDVLDLDGEAFELAIARMAKRDPARFERFLSGR